MKTLQAHKAVTVASDQWPVESFLTNVHNSRNCRARRHVPLPPRKPFYASLWVQVPIAMAVALVLGYFSPARAVAMKPLGDAFIRMITMIITRVLIFCTVVAGIAGMQDLKKVGRVGGKALLYFEIVSTIALVIGLIVGNVVRAVCCSIHHHLAWALRQSP